MKAAEIIEKYEVPKDFHEAVFEAYAEGAKRGFIDGSINVFNQTGVTDLVDTGLTPPRTHTKSAQMPSKETT